MTTSVDDTQDLHKAFMSLGGWQIEKRISIGNGLAVVMLALFLLQQWFGVGYRIEALEQKQAAQEKVLVNQTKALEEIRGDVRFLREMWSEYPPHRHIEDGVYYPRGYRPEPSEKEKKQ